MKTANVTAFVNCLDRYVEILLKTNFNKKDQELVYVYLVNNGADISDEYLTVLDDINHELDLGYIADTLKEKIITWIDLCESVLTVKKIGYNSFYDIIDKIYSLQINNFSTITSLQGTIASLVNRISSKRKDAVYDQLDVKELIIKLKQNLLDFINKYPPKEIYPVVLDILVKLIRYKYNIAYTSTSFDRYVNNGYCNVNQQSSLLLKNPTLQNVNTFSELNNTSTPSTTMVHEYIYYYNKI